MCDFAETDTSCGLGGTCVDGTCICSTANGWSKSSEFVFLTDSVEALSDPFPCDAHVPTLRLLYFLLCTLSIAGIYFYFQSIEKKSQLRRLFPYLVVSFIHIILGIIKFIDPIGLVIGINLGVTILFGVSIFSFNLSLQMFLYKYIRYHYKTVNVGTNKLQNNLQVMEHIGKAVLFLAFVMIALFVGATFAEEEINRLALVRTAMGIGVVTEVYQVVSCHIVLMTLKRDLKMLKYISKFKISKTIFSLNLIYFFVIQNHLCNSIYYFGALVSRTV